MGSRPSRARTNAERTLRGLLVAALASTSLLAAAAGGVVTVLTGRTNTIYHPLGVALGTVIGKAMPSLKTSVQATRGSVENLEALQAGRAELAFAPADALSDAWKGSDEAGFPAPLRKLRGIAALYPNYIQVVARADSGIRQLADLKGKHVSVGVRKSAIEQSARAIFAAAGVAYKAIGKVEYLPFGESVELMKNRQLDATLQSSVLGVSGLRDLATSVDVVLLAIPPDVVRKLNDPAYLPAAIPANTYRGQTGDVPSASLQNVLVTHEGVGDDAVYDLTKALWDGVDQLVAAHPAAKAMTIGNALEGLTIPLHAGAARYYRDVGVLK